MVAAGISAYLASYQYGLLDSIHDPVFGRGTARVLDSDVSHRMRGWVRLPDAALGVLAYLGDAIWGLAGSTRRWQFRPWLVIIFGIDVIPLGLVSAVLVLLQATVVGHWCLPCLITAAISLILVGLAYDEVRSTLGYLWRTWRMSERDARVLWRTFWGQPTEAGRRAAEVQP